jgi:[ribosomal protein S18]-alanine N-acetyltransferase
MQTCYKDAVRPAREQDRQSLANLIHFENYVHRHLDWRSPLDWMGCQPYLVSETNGKVRAALVCPPDPPEIAWIRMFAVSDQVDVQATWQTLWMQAHQQLCVEFGSPHVAAIPMQGWFHRLLEQQGFAHTYDVVSLLWDVGFTAPAASNRQVVIRSMSIADLPLVTEIDAAAFGPLWRNSLSSLSIAFQQAVVATLAEVNGRPVGYQISTGGSMGGHLARLAVYPDLQGRGIGYALVCDLLRQFRQRGDFRVSVNTQSDNRASLALYEKAGFHLTGERFPVLELS